MCLAFSIIQSRLSCLNRIIWTVLNFCSCLLHNLYYSFKFVQDFWCYIGCCFCHLGNFLLFYFFKISVFQFFFVSLRIVWKRGYPIVKQHVHLSCYGFIIKQTDLKDKQFKIRNATFQKKIFRSKIMWQKDGFHVLFKFSCISVSLFVASVMPMDFDSAVLTVGVSL